MIYQKHPKHGRHMPVTAIEAEANKKSGWVTITEEEFYETVIKKVEPETDDERAELEVLYEQKFGNFPHHRMKIDTIRQKLDE